MDIEASISLFRALCRIGNAANPHMTEQLEKINKLPNDNKMDLEKLLTEAGKEQTSEHVAADRGLDKQVISFIIQSSIRP